MPAPASGDPRLVERLVVNLVDNAVRHNRPGGRVDVTTGVVAERGRVTVSNTGPVVAPEEVERLLRPFERAGVERTGGREATGHGLGLTVVRAIADAHGTTLTATARLDGGLEVVVTFLDRHRAESTRTRSAVVAQVRPHLGPRRAGVGADVNVPSPKLG